jgi:hypothetical protein
MHNANVINEKDKNISDLNDKLNNINIELEIY